MTIRNYCTNCAHYHRTKEVLGVKLKYGGRAKHMPLTAYDWCDVLDGEMSAKCYFCKDFKDKDKKE